MKRPTIHYEYEESACGCGDSWCGDCRDFVTKTACNKGTRSSAERSRDVSKITCAACCRTKVFAHDQKREYERVVLRREPTVSLTLEESKAVRAAVMGDAFSGTVLSGVIRKIDAATLSNSEEKSR